MSDLSNAASGVSFGLNPTALGGAGLGLGLAGSLLGAKAGGKSWEPKFRVNDAGVYEMDTGFGFRPLYRAPADPGALNAKGLGNAPEDTTKFGGVGRAQNALNTVALPNGGTLDQTTGKAPPAADTSPEAWNMRRAISGGFAQFAKSNPGEFAQGLGGAPTKDAKATLAILKKVGLSTALGE